MNSKNFDKSNEIGREKYRNLPLPLLAGEQN